MYMARSRTDMRFRLDRMLRFSRFIRDPWTYQYFVLSCVAPAIPSRNDRTARQNIETMANMVRSLAGSPVVMWMFSFSRVSSPFSLAKGAACAIILQERHSHASEFIPTRMLLKVGDNVSSQASRCGCCSAGANGCTRRKVGHH